MITSKLNIMNSSSLNVIPITTETLIIVKSLNVLKDVKTNGEMITAQVSVMLFVTLVLTVLNAQVLGLVMILLMLLLKSWLTMIPTLLVLFLPKMIYKIVTMI